jgi:flagellar hook-associated protein 2
MPAPLARDGERPDQGGHPVSVSSSTSGTAPLFNFSGIASGLDTNSIVTALMNLEKQPQVLLQNKQTAYQATDSGYASLTSKLNTLQTALRNIGNPLDWQPVTATSSDPNRASVTSTSASSVGAISFTVQSLASQDVVASYGNVTAGAVIASGNITIGTSAGSTSVNVGGGTLDEVVQAINSQTTVGLTAAAVQVSPGNYKLQLTAINSTDTVNTSMSQFTGLGPSWGAVSSPAQAHIHVGSSSAGYDVYSNSNTFSNVLPGVNVTVKQADPLTTVNIQSSGDATTMVGKVQTMVDAYNAAVDEAKTQTAYDPTTKIAGALQGQSSVRQLQSALSNSVSGSLSTSSAATAGIELDSTGHMTFDQAKFTTAFQTSPASVQQIFADPLNTTSPALVDRLKATLTDALSPGTGYLKTSQKGIETSITNLGDQIGQYQVQLDAKEVALRAQFTTMETLLQGLQAQGTTLQSFFGQSSNSSNS